MHGKCAHDKRWAILRLAPHRLSNHVTEAETMAGQGLERVSPARGMYYLFLGNVTYLVLLAVAVIAVARLLGPEANGLYAITLVVPSYLQTAVQLGIPSAAVRYPALYAAEGDRGHANSFILSMLAFEGSLALLAILLVVPFSPGIASSLLSRPEVGVLIPLAVLSVVGNALYLVASAGLQGLNMMKGSAWLQVIYALVRLVSTIALIVGGFALMGAVAGFAIGPLVAGGVGVLLVMRMGGKVLPRGLLGDVKTALKFSLPLYAASLGSGLVSPYLVTLMTRFATDAQIGNYGPALNMSTLIVVVVYPISTTLFPLFSSLAKDERALGETYAKAVKYSSLFIVPVASFVMALSGPVSQGIYGRGYTYAGGYLLLLAAPTLLVGLGSQAQGALLSAVGETKKFLMASLVSSAVTFVAGAALIPYLGIYGAILSSILGSIVIVALLWRMISNRLRTNVRISEVWRIYLASGVAAALVYPLSRLALHPLIITLLGVAAFLLLVIPLMALTGAIKRRDVDALEGYFRSVRPVFVLFRLTVRYYSIFERKQAEEAAIPPAQ
jgi:O-antigen/teichoic acid export membrane protein